MPANHQPRRLLTEAVDEVRYLAAEPATIRRYRLIMRYFYEQHRLHQYTLTPAQIRQHVEETLAYAYTEDECKRDLDQLSQWGNLEPDWELGLAGVRTIEEFHRRNVVYAATPAAIAIEQLMVELEQQGEQVGELDGSAMARLWERFTAFEEALAGDDLDMIRQRFDDLWLLFSEVADSSNSYLGDLRRQEKERLIDLSAFQLYKEAVITYLTRFSEGLAAYRERFRGHLALWDGATIATTLAQAAAATTRQFDSLAHLQAERLRQVDAFVAWFAPGGSADQLHTFAGRAIERVLRSARRLSESRQGALSRAQDLLNLAKQFHQLEDLGAAEQLAAASFGLATPRQWQYELPEQASDRPERSPWEAEPLEVPIRTRRAYTARQMDPAAMADLRRQKEALKQRDRERQAAMAAIIASLFADGPLRLAEAPLLEPSERDLVMGWVYDCLGNSPACTTRAEDGSLIRLVDPQTTEQTWLTAPDGRLLVPAFTLERGEA